MSGVFLRYILLTSASGAIKAAPRAGKSLNLMEAWKQRSKGVMASLPPFDAASDEEEEEEEEEVAMMSVSMV